MQLEIPDSDETLLHLLSQDSEAAFDQLYDRYWKKLFSVAMHTLKDFEQSEEIVNDVLLKLWKLRATLKVERSLNHYLAAAVKYQVINHLRKENRRRNLLEGQHFKELSGEDTTGNWVREKELILELQFAVNKLPEQCQLVYHMSRELGMKTSEIAQELDIPVNTIESQLSRSLKHLRVYFKNKLGMYLLL